MSEYERPDDPSDCSAWVFAQKLEHEGLYLDLSDRWGWGPVDSIPPMVFGGSEMWDYIAEKQTIYLPVFRRADANDVKWLRTEWGL